MLKAISLGALTLFSAISFAIGYAVYFDYKRRSDPHLKRKIKKEKLLAKSENASGQASASSPSFPAKAGPSNSSGDGLLDISLEEIYQKPAADREKIFYALLMKGEDLLKYGVAHVKDAVQCFYKAMKLIPNPTELLVALQKVLPENVFAALTHVITEEGMKKVTEYFKSLPAKHSPVDVRPSAIHLPTGDIEQTWSLFATRDIEAGETIYTEVPDVSSLLVTQDMTQYCQHCCRALTEATLSATPSISCDQCFDKYCSTECLKAAANSYHPFLCSKVLSGDSDAILSSPYDELKSLCKSYGCHYGVLTAKYLALLFAEELKGTAKMSAGLLPTGAGSEPNVSVFMHYEFLKPMAIPTCPSDLKEASLIREIFVRSNSEIGEFMTDARYVAIKGTLMNNGIGFKIQGHESSEKDLLESASEESTSVRSESLFTSSPLSSSSSALSDEEEAAMVSVAATPLATALSTSSSSSSSSSSSTNEELISQPTMASDDGSNVSETPSMKISESSYVELGSTPVQALEPGTPDRSLTATPVSSLAFESVPSETKSQPESDVAMESMVSSLPMLNRPVLGSEMNQLLAPKEVIRSDMPYDSLSGIALYHLSAHLQHSCDPNVMVVKPSQSHEIAIVAKRKIRKHDELFMSYVPIKKGTLAVERRALLRDAYHLQCMCYICEAELASK